MLDITNFSLTCTRSLDGRVVPFEQCVLRSFVVKLLIDNTFIERLGFTLGKLFIGSRIKTHENTTPWDRPQAQASK